MTTNTDIMDENLVCTVYWPNGLAYFISQQNFGYVVYGKAGINYPINALSYCSFFELAYNYTHPTYTFN